MKTGAVQQAPPHTHNSRGDVAMEKPSKVVFMNDGQTKVTLTGKWFFMTPDEVAADYFSRLEAGDPFIRNINDTLCDVIEARVRREGEEV